MTTEDFRIYRVLQTVPIQESHLKNMHDEIMKIVDENYFIQQRLKVLQQLGCRIFTYKNGPDGLFERLKSFIFDPNWEIGDMLMSFSIDTITNVKQTELCYYIQVTSKRVNLIGYEKNPCTVYAEIPEKRVFQIIRKAKLLRLNKIV